MSINVQLLPDVKSPDSAAVATMGDLSWFSLLLRLCGWWNPSAKNQRSYYAHVAVSMLGLWLWWEVWACVAVVAVEQRKTINEGIVSNVIYIGIFLGCGGLCARFVEPDFDVSKCAIDDAEMSSSLRASFQSLLASVRQDIASQIGKKISVGICVVFTVGVALDAVYRALYPRGAVAGGSSGDLILNAFLAIPMNLPWCVMGLTAGGIVATNSCMLWFSAPIML
jgi:hypothetical protein